MAYEKTVCHECGQTTDYLMNLDKGSAMIVVAIYQAQKRLDKSRVHLVKEMACTSPAEYGGYYGMVKAGYLTMRMIGNATKPANFGLISNADNSGRYNVTEEGIEFLRGNPVDKSIIIDKSTHRKKGDYELSRKTTIKKLMRAIEVFWEVEGVPTV